MATEISGYHGGPGAHRMIHSTVHQSATYLWATTSHREHRWLLNWRSSFPEGTMSHCWELCYGSIMLTISGEGVLPYKGNEMYNWTITT